MNASIIDPSLARQLPSRETIARFSRLAPPPKVEPPLDNPEKLGMPLKQFVAAEAVRLGLKHSAVFMRISRGKYPGLKVVRPTGFEGYITRMPDDGVKR